MKIYQWTKNIQLCIFPPVCCLCRQPGADGLDLCTACRGRMRRIERPCTGCGLPLRDAQTGNCGFCLTQRPPLDTCCAPFQYVDPVSRLIAGFKDRHQLQQGRLLSQLMVPALRSHYRTHRLDWPDLLVPVPLHPSRLRQRGFNQALELARWFGRDLGLALQPHAIRRPAPGRDQRGLNARERRANLRGVFSLAQPAMVMNKTVAIVDDVITTLSTASAVAALLRQHGALRIDVWAPARTLRD